MLNSLLLSLIIFLFSSINILRLIQIKDYFFPSIWAHFDYPSSYFIFIRRREILLWLIWVLFLTLSFLGINIQINNQFWLLVLILVLIILLKFKKEQLLSLNWTIKFMFITFLVVLINWRILDITENSLFMIFILSTSSSQFLICIISTYVANLITNIYARSLYKKAKNKIEQWKKENPNRKVIGITGSYGKTSTKEILSQILSCKFKVLKSPLRLNAEIGLSQFILKTNLSDYEILIIEMGARRRGEISTMIEIFNPDISFLTGIGPQHVATFGSLENIILGKSEIFKSVIPKGIAFINGSDKYSKWIYEKLPVSKKYLYSIEEGHFYSINEIFSLEGTDFDFVYPYGVINLKTNLIGKQFLENLIGALACAFILGINIEEVKDVINNLKLLPHQFQVVKKSSPVIIDDSYNSNLIGVIKGAEFFTSFPIKYKVVFFAGILELGIETPKYYRELIDALRNFDKVILTFKDYTEVFEEYLYDRVVVYKKQKLEELIKEFPKEELGILILGRIPKNLLDEILKL